MKTYPSLMQMYEYMSDKHTIDNMRDHKIKSIRYFNKIKSINSFMITFMFQSFIQIKMVIDCN